jgi:hypothetical protein
MITSSNDNVFTRTGERNLKLLPSMLFATASVCLLAAGSALAAIEAPNPKDLTQGKWELQVAKSKFCKEAPQHATREIFDAGWGLVSVHWTGADSKGTPIDIRYVYRFDGQKYPSDIVKPSDVAITWKKVSPSRVEFVDWSKENKMIAENVRIVSSDGQTMTQTTKYSGKADQSCQDVQVFERK